MKTYMAHNETVVRKWYVVDAEGVVLGRLASKVAAILRGKNKPTFTPNVDTGDFVIIVNCDKVAFNVVCNHAYCDIFAACINNKVYDIFLVVDAKRNEWRNDGGTV